MYQLVMLMTLLRGGGRSSTTEITRSILAHDESQVEYYEGMTKNMVGRALRSHGIVEKEDGGYALVGFEDLDGEQIEHLIGLCESKLDDYKTRRGRRIWQHRRISAGYISDFRTVRASYDRREPGCPFCEMPKDQLVAETELAYAVRDAFPATSLHTLVIPKWHVRGCFELSRPELNACHRLLEQEKRAIEQADASVKGFNVGVNEGEVAGQTVFHCHLHLIPRRRGDVEEPEGGVRGVIPGKGVYR